MSHLRPVALLVFAGCTAPDPAWPAVPECPFPLVQEWMTRTTARVVVDGIDVNAQGARELLAGRVAVVLDSIFNQHPSPPGSPPLWILIVSTRPAIPADPRAAVCAPSLARPA